jgi:hypothetical protein
VTSVIIEKEEVIIKLKSELVVVKNQLELNDQKFTNQLLIEREKIEK